MRCQAFSMSKTDPCVRYKKGVGDIYNRQTDEMNYDLSGATTSKWTYDDYRMQFNLLREPPLIVRIKRRPSPPLLRRTDGQSDCSTGVVPVAMTEEEMEGRILRLKIRNDKLQESLQRLRTNMRVELKMD
jgi:hypothetical protein